MTTSKCPKCKGRGRLTYHLHIDNGRCFQCAGSGAINATPRKPSAAQRQDLDASIARYILHPVNNSSAYELAVRLRQLHCTESARHYLDQMKPAMREAVVAWGRTLQAEAETDN